MFEYSFHLSDLHLSGYYPGSALRKTHGQSKKDLPSVPFGGFLKRWYPTTMNFPTKNDHFGVFWWYPPFEETPIC